MHWVTYSYGRLLFLSVVQVKSALFYTPCLLLAGGGHWLSIWRRWKLGSQPTDQTACTSISLRCVSEIRLFGRDRGNCEPCSHSDTHPPIPAPQVLGIFWNDFRLLLPVPWAWVAVYINLVAGISIAKRGRLMRRVIHNLQNVGYLIMGVMGRCTRAV